MHMAQTANDSPLRRDELIICSGACGFGVGSTNYSLLEASWRQLGARDGRLQRRSSCAASHKEVPQAAKRRNRAPSPCTHRNQLRVESSSSWANRTQLTFDELVCQRPPWSGLIWCGHTELSDHLTPVPVDTLTFASVARLLPQHLQAWLSWLVEGKGHQIRSLL